MRPKYLEMSAWGPYREVARVEFEAFDQGALFLITGSTGAGKTTLFDGICFALYGNASGREREKTTLRSDFAAPETLTYVKFIFSHNGLTYEVYRNPEYLRPKKRKNADGELTYTKEKENAILTMPDGKVLEGVTYVNRKLQELMALDYSQFKQISMIAQGEFDRLLTAPSGEKTKIFRGIFGTEKYDLFTQALKNKAALSYRKYNEYKHRMEENIRTHARGDEALETLAFAESVDFGTIAKAFKDRLEYYIQEKRKLEQQSEEKEAQLSKHQIIYNQTIEQQKRREQLEQTKVRLHKLESTRNQYEETRVRLQQSEEAERISKEYVLWKDAQKLAAKWEQQTKQAEIQVENARRQYIEVEQREQEAYHSWQQADAVYKRASIGIVADLLEEGKPCPVCGAVEHPAPFQSDGTVPDAKAVERFRKAHEAVKKEQMQVYGQVRAFLEAQKKAREAEKESKEQLLITEQSWQGKLLTSSFSDETAFINARLSGETEQRYKEQVEKWERMVTETRAVIAHMTEELQNMPILEEALIKEQYQQALTERDQCRKLYQQVLLKEDQLRNGLVSLQENMHNAEESSREYGIIKDLENIASGNNTKRLVFEQYVLSSYFEDILAAANIRFRHMTMDRYEMIRKTQVSDARTKDHLDIMIVDYYTGKTRPVSTLSGGERFHASLSLALGMSDVIQAYQGGIKVEALFVDEGFGSLDEEALQTACDTLYQLTQGDKLVGIISHVDSLKQRIDNRIEICKTNRGSTLKVVS